MSELVINKSDSYHRSCGPVKGNASPQDKACRSCGVQYVTVSSDYAGGGIEDWIRHHRPDLEPNFPFENFYKSREGEELLTELTMDTKQVEP